MASTSFYDLRVHNAEQFKESLTETANTKLFLCIGKTEPWVNENEPTTANTTLAQMYEAWSNMIGGKRVFGSDVCHVVRRRNWVEGSIYKQYDILDPYPFENKNSGEQGCYIVTSDFNVYKCIGNNFFGESVIEPNHYNTEQPVQLADGYIWKFMYSIPSADQLRFMTDEFIPVRTLLAEDGSLQWEVQQNARLSNGSIHHIAMEFMGSGYANAQNVIVTVTGDGSIPVMAQPQIEGGSVVAVNVTDPGLGYTFADVTITDRGNQGFGASARAMLSPPGGHGADPIYELAANYIMIDTRLRYDEDGVLPVKNDYRQISLLSDPIDKETQNVASMQVFSQMLDITTSGSGEYNQDEIVYQGGSLTTASFKGRVVWYDPDTSKVYLINTVGTPTASRSLIGYKSFTVRILASVGEPELNRHTGNMLYIDNIPPVTRSEDQIENFKIVLSF